MLEYYMRYYNASANRAPRRAATQVNQPQRQPQRTQQQQPQPQQNQQPTSLSHHRRRCTVCRHREREAIEEKFIEWAYPRELIEQYGFSRAALYRHAKACGLYYRRYGGHIHVLEKLLERAGDATITSHAVVQAVRAYDGLLNKYKQDFFIERLQERVRALEEQRLLAAQADPVGEQNDHTVAYPTVEHYQAAAAAANSGAPSYLKASDASGLSSGPGSVPRSYEWRGEPFTVSNLTDSERALLRSKSSLNRDQIATKSSPDRDQVETRSRLDRDQIETGNKLKRGKSLKTKGGRLV